MIEYIGNTSAVADLRWMLFHSHPDACLLMFLLWLLSRFSFLVLLLFWQFIFYQLLLLLLLLSLFCGNFFLFLPLNYMCLPKDDIGFTCFFSPISLLERCSKLYFKVIRRNGWHLAPSSCWMCVISPAIILHLMSLRAHVQCLPKKHCLNITLFSNKKLTDKIRLLVKRIFCS